jgi:hypothetical protein
VARFGALCKYGSLGCLGLAGLVLVALTVVLVVAAVTAPPKKVEDRLLSYEIPTEVAGEGYSRGRIILEIREAELHVKPVEPGEPLRVEARYDVNAFALDEEFDPGTDGSPVWVYRATFRRNDRAGAFAGLVSLVRGSTARIHVFLPADVPIDLDLNMRKGGAVVRLAGLWLRTAEVDFESGAFDLSVAEPLREPMESLTIRTALGGSLLNGLGNASPRKLDVSYRVGGLDMDLGGHWLADAEININGAMGGGVVHLPSGVILEGLDLGGIEPPTLPEVKPPTLRFSVSTSRGKLELSDMRLRAR